MVKKTNISTKKVIRFSVSAFFVIIFMVTLVAASKYQAKNPIGSIKIEVQNQQVYSFVSVSDIEDLLKNNHNINLKNEVLNNVDLHKIEEIVQTNPWVEKTEVYLDKDVNLNINVIQKVPIARLIDKNGNSYFIDSNYSTMPVNYNVPVKTTVFTNVPEYKEQASNIRLRKKIAYLSRYFDSSALWSTQISQVEVNPDQTFNLYTVLGNQTVKLGDTDYLAIKMNNLQDFYHQVSNKIGWNKYQILDLSYLNQIVASPTLGQIMPKESDSLGYAHQASPTVAANTSKIEKNAGIHEVVKAAQKKEVHKSVATLKSEDKKGNASAKKTANDKVLASQKASDTKLNKAHKAASSADIKDKTIVKKDKKNKK